MIVDVRKLDRVRELADEAIAEESISNGVSRFEACTRLAQGLGFNLHVEQSGIWYFASALANAENYRAIRIYLRRGPQAATAFEGRLRAQRQCIALSYEDAALGLLCQLLDPNLDLSCNAAGEASPHEYYRAPNPLEFWNEWSYWMWDAAETHVGRREIKLIFSSH